MARKLTDIPRQRPDTPLLDTIDHPYHLRELAPEQLTELADELRAYLLYSVGCSGGHFGAGLGVVELTIALHYVFNTPEDRLVWDVRSEERRVGKSVEVSGRRMIDITNKREQEAETHL